MQMIRLKTKQQIDAENEDPQVSEAYKLVGLIPGDTYEVANREDHHGMPGYRLTNNRFVFVEDTEPVGENRFSQLVREVLITDEDDTRTVGDMMPKIQEAMFESIRPGATITDAAWCALPQWVRAAMVGSLLLGYVETENDDAE